MEAVYFSDILVKLYRPTRYHSQHQFFYLNITVVWLIVTNVSEELLSSIFNIEELVYTFKQSLADISLYKGRKAIRLTGSEGP
jgi:hypothetical protein